MNKLELLIILDFWARACIFKIEIRSAKALHFFLVFNIFLQKDCGRKIWVYMKTGHNNKKDGRGENRGI